MSHIEVTVSPQGDTKVQTVGYQGDDCLVASKFLEQSIGVMIADHKTSEFYATESAQQQTKHE